jgi:hypothetical protein
MNALQNWRTEAKLCWAIAHDVRAVSNAGGSWFLFPMLAERQPTYAARFWAASSAGVFGCAGSWSTVAS